MGRVPGFTNAIFPAAAMPNLTLVANLGLVLFLFLVGLEVDLRFLASNWRIALSVGALGMALPFGLGCAIAYGLYHEFRNEPGTVPISFGTYMLFIGVAMAITAFPVLCRILTELKLLSTSVGIIVLSAGVGNDVVGWILLALCVSLVNAGSGITALWVVLTALAYVLFLVFAVRPAFMFVLRRTHSLQEGPSQGVVALTLLIALTSAFFTGVIGIHPIFGAFMAGLICPHDGGFAIKVTEKIEDLVGTLFLPLYFALSGLSTNLGLLDNGITWGYVIGVIAVAFFAKFTGGAIAARLNGLVWRESFTIGALMSCKGLVELIVLNIGLQAKILSTRTFTIFVVMALVTTFATTPLTSALYPPWYQKKIEAWKRGEIDWDTGRSLSNDGDSFEDSILAEKESAKVRSLLVYLRLDNMPSTIAFVSLLGGKHSDAGPKKHPQRETEIEQPAVPSELVNIKRPIEVHGVRLLELTERGSSVMKVAEVDEYAQHDPLVNTFRTFGRLYNLSVSGEVAVGPESAYADILTSRATDESSDLLLLPWSESGGMSELQSHHSDNTSSTVLLEGSSYADFATRALDAAVCHTAVFVDREFGGSRTTTRTSALQRSYSGLSLRSQRDHRGAMQPSRDRGHHIFMPYFGGNDGRVALRLVLQLAENPDVTATVVYFEDTNPGRETETEDVGHSSSAIGVDKRNAVVHTASSTASQREQDAAFFAALQKSLPAELIERVVMQVERTSADPISEAIEMAEKEVGHLSRSAGDLVVVTRSSGRGEARGACLGSVANRMIRSEVRASVLVVQAARSGRE